MEETTLIAIMAILVILAAFLSIVMNKIKFPPLLGFITAGILIANYINMAEEADLVVEIFSDIGLIMLMFSIGMEIDIRKLKEQGKFAVIVAAVQLPLMVIGGVLAGFLLGFNTLQCICLGCIISGSSTAVVMAVLQSQGQLDKEHIELLVLVTIMEDIGQVIMLSMLTPMLTGGSMGAEDLAILIAEIAIFMVACFTLGLYIVPRIIDWFYMRSNDELISLLCIGALFVLSYAATKMGLSVAIGAFLMGVIVGTSRPKHAVEHFVDPIKSLFMAMFFISVGMEVTLGSLAENLALIFIIYAVFAICKTATVYLGYWVGNGDQRTGFVSAIGLCAMGEFAFIIAKQALDNGVVDQGFYSSVIGAALISMIFLPILTRYSGKGYDALYKACPNGVKRGFARLTSVRDRFYDDLNTLSQNMRQAFTSGLGSVYFNLFLIIVVEVLFYFGYGPGCGWLQESFGIDKTLAMYVLLFINILILLRPCMRQVSNIRVLLYLLSMGKLKNNRDIPEDRAKFYETMNPLLIAGVVDILIVALVPNPLDTGYQIFVSACIVLAVAIYQVYRFKVGKRSKSLEKVLSKLGAESESHSEE